MISIKKVSLVIICVGLAISSCKKKKSSTEDSTDSTTTGTTAPVMNGSMTAKLNGASWVSTKNTGMFVIDTDNNLSALVLNGETANDIFALGIDFPTANPNLSVGTHDYGGSKDDAVFTYTTKKPNGGFLTQHFEDVGTFNITAVDNTNKVISGTFSFRMHKVGSTAAGDSIYVTNGVFSNIKYAVQ